VSYLFDVMPQPFVDALGWTLLHFVWQGTAVVMIAAVLLACLRRRSANARYTVACLALVAMAAWPAMTFRQVYREAGRGDAATRGWGAAAGNAVVAPYAQGFAYEQPLSARLKVETVLTPTTTAPAAPVSSRDWAARVEAWMGWIVLAWLVGVTALAARLLAGWIHVQRMRTRRVRPIVDYWQAVLADLAYRMRISRPVVLFESAWAQVPLAIGWLRPMILLPACALTGLTRDQLRAMIAHELAHIRRYDYLVNLVQTTIETLLFYHPAVWWISRCIRAEREHCCDDLVVKVCGSPVQYARALANMEELCLAGPQLAAAATGGSTSDRIRRLLGVPAPSNRQLTGWLPAALGLMVTLGVVLIAGRTSEAVRNTESAASQPAAATPASSAKTATSQPGASRPFELQVVHRDTEKPLAGVTVDFRIDKEKRSAVTDRDGRCRTELPAKEPEDFTVTCSKDGLVKTSAFWIRYHYKLGIPPRFTIAMEPAASIGGMVQDDQGNPIEGVTLTLDLSGPGVDVGHTVYPRVRNETVRTDARGNWRFDGMPATFDRLSILLSHPDYLSDTQYGDRPTPPVEKLLAKTAIQVMKKGLTITGIVRNEKGEPIEEAKVSRNPNMRVVSWYKDVETNREGRFRFTNVPAGQMVLSVRAPGYGPDLKVLQVDANTPPIEVRLGPAHTLRGRMVGSQGKPLSGATAFAKTWRGYNVITKILDTDDEGRFTLYNAPPDEIHFEFYADGYLAHEQDLAAAEQEHVITMRPEIRVTGTVVDAATDKPIAQFTVVPGFTWDAQRKEIFWDRMHAHAMVGGKYEYEFDYPRHTHAIRIEAEGYKPAISKEFDETKSTLTIDFKLEKGEGLTGVVKGPDGKPVEGADVILGTKASSVYLENGRLRRTQHMHVQTGPDGRFSLPEADEDYALVVLHDAGYAEIKKDPLTRPVEIVLQAWGRLEGTVKLGDKPGANERVRLDFGRSSALPGAFWSYRASTDRSGKFAIDRVLPGPGKAYRELTGPRMPGGMFNSFPLNSTPIEIKPGETCRVEIGGKGRPIVGRVKLPDGADRKVDWTWGSCHLHTPKATPTWGFSTAGLIKADGSFRIDDVPAGTYELMIRVEEPNSRNTRDPMQQVGMARTQVVVPEIPGGRSDEPLDVGTVMLQMR